jgi:hypothetical protein
MRRSLDPILHCGKAFTVAVVLAAAGCSAEIQQTRIVEPIQTKLSMFNAVEVPSPAVQDAPSKIGQELQDKLVFQIGTLGRFRRVAPQMGSDQVTLVVQTKIMKWDDGNAFLRWWGNVVDLGASVYESYAKKELNSSMSGTIGDGYLQVHFRFVDKKSQQLVGEISIKGLADDPNNPRSAEDRVVDGLIAYLKSNL